TAGSVFRAVFDPIGRDVSRVRWTVVALLFGATTVNYIDRQVLAILAPTLTRDLGWRETDYARIVSWFSVAYGVGLLGMGRFMDRVGVRLGLSLAVGLWSLASMGHALVRSVAGFGVARALLGIGESGNFPAAVKTVAEWFPRRERALATGIFNAGTNVGVVLAALLVPWIALALGWRWAFLATGALDLVWLAAPLVDSEVAAGLGAVTGGWVSGALIKGGWGVNLGRKAALLVAALAIGPTMFAPVAGTMWAAVSIVAVAAGAHQWWSANLFTTVSDMFPRHAVASVVGLGGFAGMCSAFAFQRLTGAVLEAAGGSYAPIFAVLGLAYVGALAVMHVLAPRLEPIAAAQSSGQFITHRP